MSFLTRIFSAVIVALTVANAQAQQSYYRPEPHELHRFIHLGQTQTEFLSVSVEHLKKQADIARTYSRWFAHDHNRDGVVAADEVAASLAKIAARPARASEDQTDRTPEQIAVVITKLAIRLALPDPDNDGRTTWPEMQQAVKAGVRAGNIEGSDASIGSGFDEAELQETAVDVWIAVDVDNDFRIDAYEVASIASKDEGPNEERSETAASEASIGQSIRRHLGGCLLPIPPANAKIVVLEFKEAVGLSSATINSQIYRTGVGDVFIEEGDAPIYLLVRASSTNILRLLGAVDRVSHITTLSGKVGYVGPQANLSGWSRDSDCWQHLGQRSTSPEFVTLFEAALQRQIDKVVVVRELGRVTIPLGGHDPKAKLEGQVQYQVSETTRSKLLAASNIEDETLDALIEESAFVPIEPRNIQGGHGSQAYTVLPGTAGLIQLLEQGKLSIANALTLAEAPKSQREFIREANRATAVFQIESAEILPAGLPRQPYILPAGVKEPANLSHRFTWKK